MHFNDYQKESGKTRIADFEPPFVYSALGLAGETGEVVEKVKKIIRDNGGKVAPERRTELKKELGDVLWYLAQLSEDLGIELDEVAELNLEKIRSRFARGQTHGEGDNR